MHIIHIASELAPIAKVGGLGDVILGLSRDLIRGGHQVEVILPKYSSIDYAGIRGLQIFLGDLWSYGSGSWCHNTIWTGFVGDIRVYLIEPHTHAHYFERKTPYGYPDDIERFTYFSRAALEFLLTTKIQPDILHLHEWQTALAAPLYWDLFHPLGLTHPALVFTIHNLEHQGHCSPYDLERIGLPGSRYLTDDKLKHPYAEATLNLVKGGIVYSNQVTTVSPSYAMEVQTRLGGCGLHDVLRQQAWKLTGILNGLDYHYWCPASDPYLDVKFDASLEGRKAKRALKRSLQRRLALETSDHPLVAAVCRLVPQKGVELIKHAIFRTLKQGGQFVLIGSSPIPQIQEEFYRLKVRFSNNPHVHLELQHHEELVHCVFGASDLFIVPSLFEPCGLTQLIAMRYGSVPVVRRTGGLSDTVFDVDTARRPFNERNGYVFEEPTHAGLDSALDRGLLCCQTDKRRWSRLIANGMRMDFSWRQPTQHYLRVYHKARELVAS